jgi:short-subunit dehydrogenase
MADLAIVTGASSGIGLELARQLAARGLRVLAVARRRERLDALAAETNGAVVALALDITDGAAAAEVVARARELGDVTWLVNNAGTSRLGAFVEQSGEALAAIVRLNCEAPVALTAAIAPLMVARRRGRILNVASIAGFQPTPFQAVYGASKAFMLSFSEALAEELRDTGVTVTALCPGPVTTEIFAQMGVAERDIPKHEISAAACARFGIEATERGRVIAVPGAMNKLSAMSGKLAPRSLVRRVSGRVGLKYIGVTALPPKPQS